MKNLITLKKTLDASDAFGEFNAINVDYISEGAATVIADITPMSYETKYISNGIVSYIAERAAVCAALSLCEKCHCVSSVFNVLERVDSAAFLRADAVKVHHGSRTAVYEATVKDNNGTLLAKGTYTIVITE